MVTADATLEQLRETARTGSRNAGWPGRIPATIARQTCRRFRNVVDRDSHYTWDIKGVDDFSFDEILDTISGITGCSSDPEVKAGGGYISPNATLGRHWRRPPARSLLSPGEGAAFCWGLGIPAACSSSTSSWLA